MTLISSSRSHRHFETQILIVCAHYLLHQWLEFDQTSTDTLTGRRKKWLDFGDFTSFSRSLHDKISLVCNELGGVSNKHCLLPSFITQQFTAGLIYFNSNSPKTLKNELRPSDSLSLYPCVGINPQIFLDCGTSFSSHLPDIKLLQTKLMLCLHHQKIKLAK